MSKLIDLISELCPDGVERKKLIDVARINRGVRVVKSQLATEGEYPVFQNSLTPLGYYDSYNCNADMPFVISAGAAGEVGYSDVKFWAADDCLYIDSSDEINSRYIYHFLLSKRNFLVSRVRKASVPRLSRDVVEKLMIPVPPLEVQREIARVLDSFMLLTTELTTKLTTELAARKKQYEYYRNNLLTFDSSVEYKSLGDLFPYIRNGFVGTVTPFFTDEKHGIRYLEGTNIHDGMISDNEILYVTKEFHQKHIKNELQSDDILMVQSGHVGECAVVGDKYAGANCHALIILSNGGTCNSKYVCHYFHSVKGYKSLSPAMTGGTVRHVLASKMKNIKIPVPPRDTQDQIVKVLDDFETICSGLDIGLPAEIESRKKQYEFYRDKLLTFNEKV